MSGPDRPACCPVAWNLFRVFVVAAFAAAAFLGGRALRADHHEKDFEKPENATVLFDGKDLSKWQHRNGSEATWNLADDGDAGKAMEVKAGGGGDVMTKEKFKDDFVLHIEFMPPNMPDQTGQGKGNSGVYLQDNYEIQVLDSYGLDPIQNNDCAAIYNQKAPDKNAAKPPAEWQTYHIEFTAPKWDANGQKTSNARVTVYWNGELVHDDVEIPGPSGGAEGERPEGGSIRLQDHGNPVRFRNIWVREFKELEGKMPTK